jgi:hypothetical protein
MEGKINFLLVWTYPFVLYSAQFISCRLSSFEMERRRISTLELSAIEDSKRPSYIGSYHCWVSLRIVHISRYLYYHNASY